MAVNLHLKVMLAAANYCFLHQELCLFVCLQARKKDEFVLLRRELWVFKIREVLGSLRVRETTIGQSQQSQ